MAWLKRIYPPFGFGPPCDDGGEGEGEGEGEGAETTHEAVSEATSGGGKGTGPNGAPLESPGGGGVGGVETKKDTVATASGHAHAHAHAHVHAHFTVALDPWAQDGRPLIAAAGHGKEGAVRFLLSQGLSPDGSTVLSTKKVYSGPSAASNTAAATAEAEAVPRPLVRAARFGHTEVVRMLLEAGADPTLNDVDELTAVTAAAQFGWVSVLVQLPRALLLHRRVATGVCVDLDVGVGRGAEAAPLELAAQWGKDDALECILKAYSAEAAEGRDRDRREGDRDSDGGGGGGQSGGGGQRGGGGGGGGGGGLVDEAGLVGGERGVVGTDLPPPAQASLEAPLQAPLGGALLLAARYGHASCTRTLLSAMADAGSDGRKRGAVADAEAALALADRWKREDCAKLLRDFITTTQSTGADKYK